MQDKSRLATMMKQAGFYIGPAPLRAHAQKRGVRAEVLAQAVEGEGRLDWVGWQGLRRGIRRLD